MIISFILTILVNVLEVLLYGEITCWSLLGSEGLTNAISLLKVKREERCKEAFNIYVFCLQTSSMQDVFNVSSARISFFRTSVWVYRQPLLGLD